MCLEIFCSWCHNKVDGPENRPQTPNGPFPVYGNGHNRQAPHAVNGTETSKGEHGNYPPLEKERPPPKAQSEQAVYGSGISKDEYNHSNRHEPLPKHRNWEPYNGGENHISNGVAANGDTRSKNGHPKSSSVAFSGEKASKVIHSGPNGGADYNTVLEAPVQQPNFRRGAESNVFHTNGYNYPYVDDTRNENHHNIRNSQEEKAEDDEEKEDGGVPKLGQTKNRRY